MGAVKHAVSLQVAGAGEADTTHTCGSPVTATAAAATGSRSGIIKC